VWRVCLVPSETTSCSLTQFCGDKVVYRWYHNDKNPLLRSTHPLW
jgi:hypothetical protein